MTSALELNFILWVLNVLRSWGCGCGLVDFVMLEIVKQYNQKMDGAKVAGRG